MIKAKEYPVETHSAQAAPLRITVVTETYPPEINGVAMTLGRLVDGLLSRGHLVQLIRPRQSPDDAPSQREGLIEVLVKGYPIPNYTDLRFGLPERGQLAGLWKAHRPDIVHVSTEGPLGWSAIGTARKLRLPVTSSFHTNFQSYSGHYRLGLLKSAIEAYLRRLHNRTAATLVPTKALQTDLARRGYLNLSIMSRGVSTERFSPAKRSEALRESWGAGPKDLVMLCVGRLAKEKNLGVVLSAFSTVSAKHPTAKLVLVGDGPMKQFIQSTCPSVILAGMRTGEDLSAHYASADVFLFPSLSETYGNVVLEAMASGLAVLSYRCAAAAELIVSGTNGHLVPEGNAIRFIQTALALADTPQDIDIVRRQAAPSVARLDWAHVQDAFVETLRSVISAHENPLEASKGTLSTRPVSQPIA